MAPRTTRLAPSPTGSLHLGNAFSFVINWAIARSHGWDVKLRIEDLDGPRKKKGTIQETISILKTLGLDWDGQIQIQSEELEFSKLALEELIQKNKVYHCQLSRKEVAQVTLAPHTSDEPLRQGIRPVDIQMHNATQHDEAINWRFVTQDNPRTVEDQLHGNVLCTPEQDFVVWTKENLPSYQLAVVVDDHRQGITDVIRGNDLLSSSALQEQLYDSFHWEYPRWWHLPLIVGKDNKRLAKRHGDTRITTYLAQGVSPERIIGLIAKWSGVRVDRRPLDAKSFCNLFTTTSLPLENQTCTEQDNKWLLD